MSSSIVLDTPELPVITEAFRLSRHDKLTITLCEKTPVQLDCKVASITHLPELLSDRISIKCYIPDYRDYLYVFARRGQDQCIYAQYVREGEWQAMSEVTEIEPVEYIDITTVGRHGTN